MNDILRKKAERFFLAHGGDIQDDRIVEEFGYDVLKDLHESGLIRPDVIDTRWYWVRK